METTKPRTVNSIGMFDMLKGAGMLAIVLGHTAELYPLQLEGGLSLTAFVGFIYRETLMAAFFIASGYGFRKRSISKCRFFDFKLRMMIWIALSSRCATAYEGKYTRHFLLIPGEIFSKH